MRYIRILAAQPKRRQRFFAEKYAYQKAGVTLFGGGLK